MYVVYQWRKKYGYFVVQYVKYFKDKQEILDYVQAEDYDTVDKPGLCFAVVHSENGTGNHDFKFMFNDQESEEEHT